MKILIASNSFKGSLGPSEASEAVRRGVKKVLPGASVRLLPVSDGGDGLMEVLLRKAGGKILYARVRGPLGRPVLAGYAILSDGKTAVVEMARASGLALLRGRKFDVLSASSYGTGELIAAALRKGVGRVIVGLGGSASNDGGAGAARALGGVFLGGNGKELPPGGGALIRLSCISAAGMLPGLKQAEIIGVSDVQNPLLGRYGSARVYGPQKGASGKDVKILADALLRYSAVVKRDLGKDIGWIAGGAAAGGLGAGLAAFAGAKLVRGAGYVLDFLGAAREIEWADVVITGEGRFDFQSFFGKAPVAVGRLAKKMGKPALLVCGDCEVKDRRILRKNGIEAVTAVSELGAGKKDSISRAALWVEEAAEIAVKRYLAVITDSR